MQHGGNSFKMVTGQAPQFNTTVYVGNLPPHTTQEDLVPFFQPFGFVVDMRLQAERGFAFVKLETHEKAANAIVRLAGTMINGRPAKVNKPPCGLFCEVSCTVDVMNDQAEYGGVGETCNF